MKRVAVVLFAYFQIFTLVASAQAADAVATNIHDFIVLSIKAPKKVKISQGGSAIKPVKVLIQNIGGHEEIFPDLTSLSNVVQLVLTSFGTCPVPAQEIQSPKKSFPLTLGLKKKLSVVFNITFDCADDTNPGFSYVANLYHSHLGGPVDDVGYNDNCPRAPVEGDKGCGSKDPNTHELGGDVVTDVVVK